jgi:hypothetical protein
MESYDLLWVGITCKKPAPKWRGIVAIASDGVVFFPASVADRNERVVLVRALQSENVPSVYNYGHVYIPVWWLVREYPKTTCICRLVEHWLRQDPFFGLLFKKKNFT